MFDVARLIILHKKICDHAFDVLARLQIVVAFEVEAYHVRAVKRHLSFGKFHCIFIFAVAVLSLVGISGGQTSEQVVDRLIICARFALSLRRLASLVLWLVFFLQYSLIVFPDAASLAGAASSLVLAFAFLDKFLFPGQVNLLAPRFLIRVDQVLNKEADSRLQNCVLALLKQSLQLPVNPVQIDRAALEILQGLRAALLCSLTSRVLVLFN